MIFVTVGTHEQQFNRLVEYMDKWASKHEEEVVIQTGYSTYEPKNAKWSKLYPYPQMIELVEKARIIITHGGPSSFIMPLQVMKTPIVVPRQKKYDEHVNDHQVRFCKEVEQRMGTIMVVEDVDELEGILSRYEAIISNRESGIMSNNANFCEKIEMIVENMFTVDKS